MKGASRRQREAAPWTHREPPFIGELPETRDVAALQAELERYLSMPEEQNYASTLRLLDELMYVRLIAYAKDVLAGRVGYNIPYPVAECGYNFSAVYHYHVRQNLAGFAGKLLIFLACSASIYFMRPEVTLLAAFAFAYLVIWAGYTGIRRRVRQKKQQPFVALSEAMMDAYRAVGDAWAASDDERESKLDRLERRFEQLAEQGDVAPDAARALYELAVRQVTGVETGVETDVEKDAGEDAHEA